LNREEEKEEKNRDFMYRSSQTSPREALSIFDLLLELIRISLALTRKANIKKLKTHYLKNTKAYSE
jgi:hypothetical protein